MKRFLEADIWDEPLYLAGQCPPPGMYQEVSSGKTVTIGIEDLLPATLDGHVACYRRISCTWSQIKGGMADQKAAHTPHSHAAQSAGDRPSVHVSAASDLGKVTTRS